MATPGDSSSASRILEQDTPCRRCGYNLRGLAELGRCPECHAPVMLALLPQNLPIIDPEWIERVLRGCRLATWGVYIFLISFTVMVGVGVSISTVARNRMLFGDAIAQAWAIIGGGCLLISAIGLWLATQPHPSFSEFDRKLPPRRIARACLALLPVTLVAVWFVDSVAGRAAALVPIAIGCPFGFLGLVGCWGFAIHVESIGRDIGDPTTVRKSRWYRQGFAFVWILTWVGAAGSYAGGGFGFVVVLLVGAPMMFGYAFLMVGLATYLNNALPNYLLAAKAKWEHAEREAESHASPTRPRNKDEGWGVQ